MTGPYIALPCFTDAHVHLRQGVTSVVIGPYTSAVCDNVIAMPNTDPPIHDPTQISDMRFRYEASCDLRTHVHMTAKLLPRTSPADMYKAKEAGVIGYKLYPAGVTTNSDDGIPYRWLEDVDLKEMSIQLGTMDVSDLVLLCHGESDGFVMDREHEFLEVLERIHYNYKRLRLTLEHITTAEGLSCVRRLNRRRPGSVLGTITLHHLETTLDDVIGGKLKPDLFCKPIPKRPVDRDALLDAALSGEQWFALGSDSAPHAPVAKYGACGCAGVFTAPVLAQGIVSLFDANCGTDGRERLIRFTSHNANVFYSFTPSGREFTLERKPFFVPPGCGGVVPYRAGETLPWSLAD